MTNFRDFRNFSHLWSAKFTDGHVVAQDPDDKYSKYDPNKEHNPSSFRDFLDYLEENKDVSVFGFKLYNIDSEYTVDFSYLGKPFILYREKNEHGVQIERKICVSDEYLTNTRPIYFRKMEIDVMTGKKRCLGYVLGYQGNTKDGNNYKKTITIEDIESMV